MAASISRAGAAASCRVPSFREVASKAVVVHTVSYFVVGLVAFLALDYTSWFADPRVAAYMRQTDDAMVMAGPLFQPARGLLFGVVAFVLRDVVFRPRTGWRALWLVLLLVGILSPFGAAPGSIEGMVYTTWPLAWHLRALPEIVVQALMLAWGLQAWVTRPTPPWVAVTLGIAFTVAIILPLLGLLTGG